MRRMRSGRGGGGRDGVGRGERGVEEEEENVVLEEKKEEW